MPNPNAIVSTTVRLDPPLDRAPDDMLHAEGGIAVLLDGDRRARLDPADTRSVGFARVLDGLARLSARMVWIDASTFLHVNTRNNPQCFLEWGWHVAPTLCVRGAAGGSAPSAW